VLSALAMLIRHESALVPFSYEPVFLSIVLPRHFLVVGPYRLTGITFLLFSIHMLYDSVSFVLLRDITVWHCPS
jgi:hypothetical protein